MIAMLSDYDPSDFETLDTLRRPNFKRWNGAIDLWQSGIRSEDALLLDTPDDAEIMAALKKFAARNEKVGARHVQIRFNHSTSLAGRPGISPFGLYDFEKIMTVVRAARTDGWVSNLVAHYVGPETFDTVCALSYQGDGFVAEFLPAGFYMADISKSIFTPSAIIRTKPFAPSLRELADDPHSFGFYLDYWREDADAAAAKRERRLRNAAEYRGHSIAEQTEFFQNNNPRFFDGFIDTSPDRIFKLVRLAADFADFYKSRGFELECTTLAVDGVPPGRWILENIWNAKKFSNE